MIVMNVGSSAKEVDIRFCEDLFLCRFNYFGF